MVAMAFLARVASSSVPVEVGSSDPFDSTQRAHSRGAGAAISRRSRHVALPTYAVGPGQPEKAPPASGAPPASPSAGLSPAFCGPFTRQLDRRLYSAGVPFPGGTHGTIVPRANPRARLRLRWSHGLRLLPGVPQGPRDLRHRAGGPQFLRQWPV